ncbi:hypothetical protein HPQ64_18625 [Rhizobiales bacterium]|uniref:hypothetical protein n=1 Tax=Hongsoonwoonella zoysiae TaxID=2821844 RepID=UPI00155FA833|nr:hypothetical protein [Hongsoonwoonella zoysiae]NRG19710.1 hypothetical protein [Hongsoonwoonella zoysiae]
MARVSPPIKSQLEEHGLASPGFSRRDPRPFAVGYRRGAGEPLVYGAVVVAGIFVAAAMIQHEPLLLLGIGPALWCAYRYYPMIEARMPRLGANADGLFVDGIGFLDWSAIDGIELYETSVRNIHLSSLRITLNRPFGEAVSRPQALAPWRRFMTRSWSLRHGEAADGLEVELHPLAANPHEVRDRIMDYLPRRGA